MNRIRSHALLPGMLACLALAACKPNDAPAPVAANARPIAKAAPANADTTFEYSISVEGCGQRKTYRVVCPAVGSACFVAQDRSGG